MKTITLEEFFEQLDAIGDSLANLDASEVFAKDIKPIVLQAHAANFDNARSPDGQGWPARKVVGDGHPLLQETGALRAAATGSGSGYVESIQGQSAAFGVDKGVDAGGLPGAAAHNFGYPPGNLPQREFLGASEDFLLRMDDAIANGVGEILFGKD